MGTTLLISPPDAFRDVLQSILAAYQQTVLTAESVEAALPLLASHQEAMILLDLIEERDSDSLGRLRQQAPGIPVTAVTASQTADLERLVREAGLTGAFRKSLRLEPLVKLLYHLLERLGVPQVAPPSWKAIAGLNKTPDRRVLIVDDEPEIGDMVGEFLHRRGYTTEIAHSGEEALLIIQENPPDLVLMDIYMPGMNGVEVLRRMNNPSFPVKSLPGVIMLTASQEELLLQESLELGAFDILMKPVDLKHVEIAVLAKLVIQSLPSPPSSESR